MIARSILSIILVVFIYFVSAAPVDDESTSLEKRATYRGDGTYFYPGLGSCGHYNKKTDMIAALNHVQMKNGPNPNNNKKCGRYITVKGPRGSVRVKIVDTCPDCHYGSVDLSPAAFKKIAALRQGRVGITWHWD